MSRIAPEVWTRLASERPQGETLWARRAAPDVTERLVAALDSDARRHLLVLLTAGEGDLQDTQSRGVVVVTRDLAMPGHEVGRYLDLTCHDATGHEAFDLIGGELAERLVTGRETIPEVVARVLARWRRFWGQVSRQMLSREEQVGLFAEIWFLSVWLAPRTGAGEAVTRWRGPSGSRHDFEWAGKSVEVKATTSTRGRIHRINGLDQLAPPEQGELLFFSLRLREEAGATNSLPAIVASCRGQLASDADALGRFEGALVQAGYSPVHEDEYAKFRLRVVEERLFRVEEAFPRLTAASFPSGVPGGIERVEYEINVSQFDHLRLASQPGEWRCEFWIWPGKHIGRRQPGPREDLHLRSLLKVESGGGIAAGTTGEQENLADLPTARFVAAWCAIAYLQPGLHPDANASADSGWPRVLRRFAAEAWRRAEAGELTQ